MNSTVKMVFGLIGGLAMFLYGMNSMSDALQKAAGEKMKKILEFLTRNPVMGALAGALVTAVLQSSSATTVMVIGFVSAGLMSLPQAISVIFGANIGTTMTAQLMAFKISNYIYPIIFIGFMLNFAGKKEKIKNIGMVIFSFGLLFEGIEIMGNVMKPLAGSAIFVDLMSKVSSIPVLGVLLGTVMTLVVQSSSATIAVLQSFASQPGPDGITSVMGLTGAIPILLGDNIGTTITAILASIGQSKNAKRTAIAHSIFNISGTFVFIWIIPIFARFIQFISPSGNEVDVISRQIANAHTTFNIVCTLVWLPLVPLMVKIVTTIISGEDRHVKAVCETKYLDDKMIDQPVAAMYLVSQEVESMSDFAINMLVRLQEALKFGKAYAAYEKFKENMEAVCNLQESITNYITRLFSSGNLTGQQSEQAAALLYVANNIQRIADRCKDIDEIWNQIEEKGMNLSKIASKELDNCIGITINLLKNAIAAVKEGESDRAELVFQGRKQMHKAQKKFNKAHLNRIKTKECIPGMTGYFSGILHNLDRAAESCVSIAEEAIDHPGYIKLGEYAEESVDEYADLVFAEKATE